MLNLLRLIIGLECAAVTLPHLTPSGAPAGGAVPSWTQARVRRASAARRPCVPLLYIDDYLGLLTTRNQANRSHFITTNMYMKKKDQIHRTIQVESQSKNVIGKILNIGNNRNWSRRREPRERKGATQVHTISMRFTAASLLPPSLPPFLPSFSSFSGMKGRKGWGSLKDAHELTRIKRSQT